MYKACIFDLDGTIIDTVESMAYSANKALKEFGYEPNPIENYKIYAGEGQYELIKRSLIDAGDKDLTHYDQVMARYIEMFKQDCIYHIKSYDGIITMLEHLKEIGIKIAVLTNKQHNNALLVLETVFGKGFFHDILGQKETHKRKPSEEGALILANNLGVEPFECLYIGDTPTDMQTGNLAGMHTVGVTWGFRSRIELEENAAKNIIDSPMEILNIIK